MLLTFQIFVCFNCVLEFEYLVHQRLSLLRLCLQEAHEILELLYRADLNTTQGSCFADQGEYDRCWTSTRDSTYKEGL